MGGCVQSKEKNKRKKKEQKKEEATSPTYEHALLGLTDKVYNKCIRSHRKSSKRDDCIASCACRYKIQCETNAEVFERMGTPTALGFIVRHGKVVRDYRASVRDVCDNWLKRCSLKCSGVDPDDFFGLFRVQMIVPAGGQLPISKKKGS